MKRQLTDNETTMIEAALRVAGDEYAKIAANCAQLTGQESLAKQFRQQAVDVRRLRDLFSDLPTVTIDTGETEE